MDNLINSLVGNFVSNAGNANMNGVTDYQGNTYNRDQLLALSRQVAGSIDPSAIKGGVFSTQGESVGFNYDQATNLLGHPPTAAEQVILDMSRHLLNEGVTDLNQADASTTNRRFGSTFTGGGGTIYELKKDADGKPIISTWSKDTSDKKAIIGGLALAALAFGIPGVSEGLLSGSTAGTTMGTLGAEAVGGSTLGTTIGAGGATALEGASALGSLGTLGTEAAVAGMGTGTGLTVGGAGGLGGATGVSSLGGSLGSGLTTAGAGGLGGATGAAGLGGLGTGVGAGVGGMAAGNSLLGNAALGSTLAGVSTLPAGSALSSLGAGGGSLLNAAGAGAATSALGTTLGQGLALSALGTGLGAVANQSGISNARDLINQYGTKAEGNLARSYADAQALNRANRGDLTSNYARTQNKLGNIYDQQVEFQQPYQAVGRAGSEALVENVPYFNKQFGTADLYSGLAPNYEFMLGQGQMANQRMGNMGGGALGGNALQGLQKYTQDYAGNAYQNAFNNFQNQRQNIYGNLAGMANIGTTSAGQLANLGNTYGSNLAGLSSNYGNNLTTSYGQGIGAANAYGLNTANLATGIGGALASNATASGANTSTALSNLGNAALFGSMLKAT